MERLEQSLYHPRKVSSKYQENNYRRTDLEKETVKIYSKKVGGNIEVVINPRLTKKERLNRMIGLSNAVATG